VIDKSDALIVILDIEVGCVTLQINKATKSPLVDFVGSETESDPDITKLLKDDYVLKIDIESMKAEFIPIIETLSKSINEHE
jgi:hypothetical protein